MCLCGFICFQLCPNFSECKPNNHFEYYQTNTCRTTRDTIEIKEIKHEIIRKQYFDSVLADNLLDI